MLYRNMAIRKTLENPNTPTIVKNLLEISLHEDMQKAEFALEEVLDLIKERNRELFPHLRKKA